MKLFNSMQFVATYIALPFGISYLFSNPFAYAGVLAWSAVIFYLIMTIIILAAVYRQVAEEDGFLVFIKNMSEKLYQYEICS